MSLAVDIAAEPPTPRTPKVGSYALTLAMVTAATAVAIAAAGQASIPSLSLIFVLPVVAAAAAFGWGPALAAAVAGVVAYNFFLIPPLYTLRVESPANMWALGLLTAVGAITSGVASEARKRALDAREAAAQALALQGLARALVAAPDRAAVAEGCADALARLFAAPAVVLLETDGTLRPAAVAGGAEVTEADIEAAGWSLATKAPARADAYPSDASRFDFWPVVSPRRQRAAIGVAISGREASRPAMAAPLMEMVAAYLAVALDRDALSAEVLDARVANAGERLKADLLAAVSHDLKTPLSTILLSLQSLRAFREAHDRPSQDQLLALAETEAARLTRLVEDLLDTHRLDAGAVRPSAVAAAPDDLIDAAVIQAAPALAGRAVERLAATATRPLKVDPALFGSALAKVLENAGRYGPEGSIVRVRAGCDDDQGWVEVDDEGPGFAGPVEPLFGRFTRGVTGDGRPPGLGLGLSIARGFMAAMGGRVVAGNRPDGRGARVRLIAPLA